MLSRNRLSFLTPLLAASLLLSAIGCGGTTAFSGAQSFAVAGTPPPPPPPPPPAPPPRVELRDNKIDFKEKIQFEVNKAIIKPESDSLLHDIAEVIKKNPQVKKLSIEGHASVEGDAKKNKTLSEQRAKAVVDHLIKKEGVDASRMVAKGWGIEKPLVPHDAIEENREKNRRVEFLVIEQDVTQKKVEIDPTTGKEKVVDTKTESIKAPGDATAPATPATPAKPGTPATPATPAKPKAATPTPAKPATPATPAAPATPKAPGLKGVEKK
jgi:OOP family OmpA-OmpF porin